LRDLRELEDHLKEGMTPMNSQAKQRLRRAYDQAVVREEDLSVALADEKRELAAMDERFEPGKAAVFRKRIAVFERELEKAGEEVDRLRKEVRAAGVPPVEEPHPGGAVQAIKAREKNARPTQWNQGGTISSRDAEWAAPEVPGSNRGRR
jgi:hypothetical protein